MKRLSKSLTKRASVRYGSIKHIGITELEKMEYMQNGMIRIKDYPSSHSSYASPTRSEDMSYYDFAESNRMRWFDELDLF